MLSDVGLWAAFTVGIFGGVHCLGMCGGIVTALGLGIGPGLRERPRAHVGIALAYNLGRIASYTIAGGLAGGIGRAAGALLFVNHAQAVLEMVAAAFMLALGLYLAGWWPGLARVEAAGGRIWRRLEPLARRLWPVGSLPRALAAGLVWGWLPCGLVYSVLVWSLAAGDALSGAALMASFGLGTLPLMLATALGAGRLAGWLRRPWARRLAGGLVVVWALVMAWRAAGLWLPPAA